MKNIQSNLNQKLNEKEMVNMNRELNLNELETVTGGKRSKTEIKEDYKEAIGKIDTLKAGYHGHISRGSQVFGVLKDYKKEARGYKREYFFSTGKILK